MTNASRDETSTNDENNALPVDIRLKMDEYVDQVIKARVERIEGWVVKFGKWVGIFSAVGLVALVYSGYRETIRLAENAAKDTATATARNTTTADRSEKISER